MYFRYLTFSCPGQTKFIHSTEKKIKKIKKIRREEWVYGAGGGMGEKERGMQGTLSDGHSGFMVTLFHLASYHSDEHGGGGVGGYGGE